MSGQRGKKRWQYLVLVMLVLGAYGYWTLGRPLPSIKPVAASSQLQRQTPASQIIWPSSGQAALNVSRTSIAETHGSQIPVPIASTAKLITALVVLQKKPLTLGQQGPLITLNDSDVALYNAYAAQDGSVVRVVTGEQISEYQMLQTMLLPSANNMADSLAIWAFGSLKAYSMAANQALEDFSLVTTHVGSDASGLSPTTTSTARDLARIGVLTVQNPVLAQIVNQPTASGIPVVGTIKNVNTLLGSDNIIGIKTGNSDQAGGVFVTAARVIVDNQPTTIVGSVVGTPSLFSALKSGLTLIDSAQRNFTSIDLVKIGTVAGSYVVPWGGGIPAIASTDLSVSIWKGNPATATIKLNPLPATAKVGQTTGTISTKTLDGHATKSIPITLKASPTKPSVWWRLLHPISI